MTQDNAGPDLALLQISRQEQITIKLNALTVEFDRFAHAAPIRA
jgi:hypothetical protein